MPGPHSLSKGEVCKFALRVASLAQGERENQATTRGRRRLSATVNRGYLSLDRREDDDVVWTMELAGCARSRDAFVGVPRLGWWRLLPAARQRRWQGPGLS